MASPSAVVTSNLRTGLFIGNEYVVAPVSVLVNWGKNGFDGGDGYRVDFGYLIPSSCFLQRAYCCRVSNLVPKALDEKVHYVLVFVSVSHQSCQFVSAVEPVNVLKCCFLGTLAD